jgi:hypothetical protein
VEGNHESKEIKQRETQIWPNLVLIWVSEASLIKPRVFFKKIKNCF